MSDAPPDAGLDAAALVAALARVRAHNEQLAERFRRDPTPELRDELRRAAARLHALRDQLEALRAPPAEDDDA